MIEGIRRIHLIGIGGIGVSGVARVMLELGYEVTGSDVRESQITTALRDLGATVHIGHDAAHVAGADLVVHSTAVPETNQELVAAREQGIRVVHRSEILGDVMARHELSVGVAGTHGKGTVSSMVTVILEAAGWNPGFIIGGLLEDFDRINARTTGNRLMVAEVDESDGSLRNIHPNLVVLNNLEADHLNYYDDLAHVQATVLEALNGHERVRQVVLNADCPGALALIGDLEAEVVTFGRENGHAADVQAANVDAEAMGGAFDLVHKGDNLGRVTIEVPGLYNLDNALAASAAALTLGVPFEAIQRGLASFRGLENRYTVVEAGSRRVIKDYISHPTGIRRVLEAAAQHKKRITAVFKPYRFTMINYLQDDYAEAFHDADHTVITELYTAGEVPIPGIDTEFLCDKIRSRGPEVTYIKEMDDIVPWLVDHVGEGEQVLFFGGDDLFRLADAYVAALDS